MWFLSTLKHYKQFKIHESWCVAGHSETWDQQIIKLTCMIQWGTTGIKWIRTLRAQPIFYYDNFEILAENKTAVFQYHFEQLHIQYEHINQKIYTLILEV